LDNKIFVTIDARCNHEKRLLYEMKVLRNECCILQSWDGCRRAKLF